MSNSPNLDLPLIQPAQAQKHITHNEALERLDAWVQLSVEALEVITPPVAPVEGQVWGVGTGATGAWAGLDGRLAYFSNGAFLYLVPRNGLRAWNRDTSSLWVHDGAGWHVLMAKDLNNLGGVGINAASDADNRLSVASNATLLSHEGTGHQLKLNKAAQGDTASLLFQTGFSGRAEMGLTGGDDFTVKVSADGAGWSTALRVDAGTGALETGPIAAAALSGDAVQAAPADTTPGRLMRADWGYGPGNAVGPVSQAGGTPTGAIVERGETVNGSYVRWADGTQMCHAVSPIMTCDHYTVGVFSGSDSHTWVFPTVFASAPTVTLTPYRESGPHAHFAMIRGGGFDASSVRVYLLAADSGAQGSIHMTAFGRWF